MKFIFVIFSLISLTSCLTVSFNQPQPKDGQRLLEYPEELRGTWTWRDRDAVTIDANGIETMSLIEDSLGKVIDTSYVYDALSDSIRIYRGGRFYIQNERNTNGSWFFGVLKVDLKGNINVYQCDDVKFYNKLKELTVDSVFCRFQYYAEEIDELVQIDTMVLNPSREEFSKFRIDEIQRIYFNGQIRIQDLRKIAVRKNLILRFNADGTMEESEEDDL